jgi:pimeloyl-ACP methyl ester carboxylesterase
MGQPARCDAGPRAWAFDVPVHLVVGRYDQNIPAELTVELLWLERSAHMVPFEEPLTFNTVLTDAVLH